MTASPLSPPMSIPKYVRTCTLLGQDHSPWENPRPVFTVERHATECFFFKTSFMLSYRALTGNHWLMPLFLFVCLFNCKVRYIDWMGNGTARISTSTPWDPGTCKARTLTTRLLCQAWLMPLLRCHICCQSLMDRYSSSRHVRPSTVSCQADSVFGMSICGTGARQGEVALCFT